MLALLLSSVLQCKAAHGGLKLTIEKLLAELSGVTELINLFAAPDKGTRGRYRAEYVLSEQLTYAGQAVAGYLTSISTPIAESVPLSVYTGNLAG